MKTVWRFFTDGGRRWRRNERGNVFILFGLAAVPLLLIMGGAVDFTRYARYKATLANAVDASALALARVGENYSNAQATIFVENYISGLGLEDVYFTIDDYDAQKITNGYRVSADATMATTFLPLGGMARSGGGIMSMGLDIVAEVVHSSQQVELALVFDNTGSMNCGAVVSGSCTWNWSNPPSDSRIAGLKSAANTLINILMTPEATAAGQVKVAVVPFEGAVNTGADPDNPPSWIDWGNIAQAKYNGRNFDTYEGSNDRVGHRWLFDKLHAEDSRVEWAGCVEMRAEPYDILDTTPTTSNPDTLFVPFFWPDEPSRDNNDGNWYSNNYLRDRVDFDEDPYQAQPDLTKYNNIRYESRKRDVTFPYSAGPNHGCPTPILPLTSDKSAVVAAIDNMVAYPAMGTYIPTGLVWGWHVLTPNEPFTEGLGPSDDDYDKTVKAIVLLTDGENSVTTSHNHNISYFSAYNYTALEVDENHRLGSSDPSTAKTELDARTAALCENVKRDHNIRLYTITFGDISEATKTLMRNCATEDEGVRLYYDAPDNSELNDAFASIGEDLSDIHLSM